MAGPPGSTGPTALGGALLQRRFTWFMALRAAVTTLLFAAAVLAEAARAAEREDSWRGFTFALLGVTYGLTLLFAILLRRGGSPARLAALLIACDAVLVSILVNADGGAESGFVALYVLVTVGAAVTLPRLHALPAAILIALAYVAVALGARLQLVPSWPGGPVTPAPLGPFLFTLVKNLVLLAASFALSRRLAGEVEEAGARFAAQGARLDELTALHADVVRSMPSGLLTVGGDGRVLSINPAGEEILGLGAGEVLGRPLADRVPQMAALLVDVGGAPEGGPRRRLEVAIAWPDGERRVVGLSVAKVVSAKGQPVGQLVTFQDLTQLRAMQERVERQERLAAIGRLAAGVAHEIRNPLAAISGSIELLAPSVAQDADSRELLAILTREAERLDRLIADLLDFARPRAPTVAPLEVGTTLREILRVVENDRRLNPTANRFLLRFDEELWVEADPGQLRQVVLNLLINAADATPGGEPIELCARADGDAAVIEVRDHGPGIAPEARARLFEPFFTTKKTGTGLGLATVHRIIEDHHGTIEVDQPAGGGAIFRLRLPRRPPAQAQV